MERVITTMLSSESCDLGLGRVADVLYNVDSNLYSVRCYIDNVLVEVVTDETWIHEDAALDFAESYINEE